MFEEVTELMEGILEGVFEDEQEEEVMNHEDEDGDY